MEFALENVLVEKLACVQAARVLADHSRIRGRPLRWAHGIRVSDCSGKLFNAISQRDIGLPQRFG